ncbi:MAG: sigma-70 family RNA polymerase sigma factor [Planctomycetota bacterium]
MPDDPQTSDDPQISSGAPALAEAAAWLDRYGDKLYAYALARVGGDAPAAEDLVQETLLAGIKAYPRFEGKSAVDTWLISILRRKIIDRFRRLGREPREERPEDSVFDERGSLIDVADWGPDAAARIESKEFFDVLDGCLAELSPPLAEAFTLCVMDGISTEQACSILGVTPTNLSVRLHRARVTLRKLLQSRWFEGR